MIDVSNVSKKVLVSNVELTILDSLSLKVETGESLAVIGPSGSGKSTLLGIMAGLDEPSTGTVSIAGINITDMSEEGRAGVRTEHVGFVFQSFHLLQSLTALENVSLPLELKSSSDPQNTATQYLERVGLEHRMHHYPRQLSGGEQQRVALARAFACRPNILFADEPTGNLDIVTGEAINNLLFELNREEGTTLVIVTHEQSLAALCSRQLHLKSGQNFTPVQEMKVKC
jgi:putative ABC transport system ATP-binding protein